MVWNIRFVSTKNEMLILNIMERKTKRETKQLKRLKTMKAMESHRPLVVKSLDEQIKKLS